MIKEILKKGIQTLVVVLKIRQCHHDLLIGFQAHTRIGTQAHT